MHQPLPGIHTGTPRQWLAGFGTSLQRSTRPHSYPHSIPPPLMATKVEEEVMMHVHGLRLLWVVTGPAHDGGHHGGSWRASLPPDGWAEGGLKAAKHT